MRIIIEIDNKHIASYFYREDTTEEPAKDTQTEEPMLSAVDGGAAAPLDDVQTEDEGALGSYDEPMAIGGPGSGSGSAEDAGAAPDE
jgi:hypothetical protein